MKKPGDMDFVDTDCGLYKPKGENMKKSTKKIVIGTAALAAIIIVAFACCNGCGKTNSSDEQQNKEFVEVNPANDSLKVENADLQKDKKALTDSLAVLQDSLKNVSARLTDCEKGKRCPVKKVPAKKPVKKPAPVVAKPAPVVVKPDTIKPAPVVVKPDTVVVKPQVVVQDNANHNVVNINNGTVNNYYGSAADTTKCRIIVRAKITQTIKTR